MTQSDSNSEGVLQTAGELAKSLGRFSLAVPLYAARQMATMFSSSRPAATHSFDQVVRVSGSQLTGAVRTA